MIELIDDIAKILSEDEITRISTELFGEIINLFNEELTR